jgi:hypothetical protein
MRLGVSLVICDGIAISYHSRVLIHPSAIEQEAEG